MTTIRPYRPVDHRNCRQLWAELTEHHRQLFDDPSIGGQDAGAAFEEYLTRLDLSGMWVADHPEDGVVGFAGLVLEGRSGEVHPIVVTAARRGQGIGRALLERVGEEARKRSLRQLTISPVTRDREAIRRFHDAGYTALSAVTLTMDLAARGHQRREGLELHGQQFTY